jgi:hypothetical protein
MKLITEKNMGNVCNISFLYLLSSGVFSQIVKIKVYGTIIYVVFCMGMKLKFSHIFFFLICIVGGGIKVHSTLQPLNGLLCQPRVIMIMEKSVE